MRAILINLIIFTMKFQQSIMWRAVGGSVNAIAQCGPYWLGSLNDEYRLNRLTFVLKLLENSSSIPWTSTCIACLVSSLLSA